MMNLKLSVLFCCLLIVPVFGDGKQTYFLAQLYTRNSTHSRVLRYNQADDLEYFDPKRNTKVIISGAYPDHSKPTTLTRLKNALLTNYDINVIVVSFGDDGIDVQTVGLKIGRLLEDISSKTGAQFETFHLIGHSVGAHVASVAGKYLIGRLGQITALDPSEESKKLDYADARFIDVYHTDIHGYGLETEIGHINIYVNNGGPQPGCLDANHSTHVNATSVLHESYFSRYDVDDDKYCSHKRSMKLYLESIVLSDVIQYAYMCESYEKFFHQECRSCEKHQCVRFGPESWDHHHHNLDAHRECIGKRFYIDTQITEPYLFSRENIKKTVKERAKTRSPLRMEPLQSMAIVQKYNPILLLTISLITIHLFT